MVYGAALGSGADSLVVGERCIDDFFHHANIFGGTGIIYGTAQRFVCLSDIAAKAAVFYFADCTVVIDGAAGGFIILVALITFGCVAGKNGL